MTAQMSTQQSCIAETVVTHMLRTKLQAGYGFYCTQSAYLEWRNCLLTTGKLNSLIMRMCATSYLVRYPYACDARPLTPPLPPPPPQIVEVIHVNDSDLEQLLMMPREIN